MKDMPVAKVRNFALLGHTGSGKTTLLDALLFKLGATDRKGSPEQGTSFADWTEEEKERKLTIWAKPFEMVYSSPTLGRHELTVLDTPGYADYYGQVIAATTVADAGVLLVDATAGIQVGTQRAWRRLEALNLPRAIVISGVDRDNAHFDATLAAIQSAWGPRCRPVTAPAGEGLTRLLAPNPPAEVAEQRNALIEAAAETDDALLEKYLGGEALTDDELARGLRRAVVAGGLIPVFALSTVKDKGVTELLEGICALLPSPLDREVTDADGKPVPTGPDAPLSAFVWRTINDPFVGHLALIRIYGGTLKPEGELFNVTKGQKERIGAMFYLNGKKQEPAAEAEAGDIVAVPKLKVTGLNDTLGAPGATVRFPPLQFPHPVVSFAVTPKTQGDDDKLVTGLRRVAEEDPTLRVERNAETHELILSGMGDVQLNIAVQNMKKHSHVDVLLSTPKVAYKETINGRAEGHHKHKKQSGGRGQYGEVYLRVAPLPPGETEWFENAVVGGTIPTNFMPAVQKGLVEGLQRGALANYPVVNVKVTVYEGTYHDVDSSEVSFKIAGARALRDGLSKAKPVLLEPIMKLRIMAPDSALGDITGDLNHRRGRILGMENEDGLQVIVADVPQAEAFNYSSQLRSMTGGRGTFEMEYSRMDVVPSNIAQKIAAEAQKHVVEDEE